MKTLKESILGSTNTGKNKVIYEKIESWCKEFKPFNGKYKINSDNTISSTGSGNDILILRYDTYTELPDYIQFADDKNIRIAIGEVEIRRGYNFPYKKSHVKPALIESFRGLPKICKRLDILTESRIIPDLEIKAENVRLDLNWHLSSCGDIKIDFFGEGVLRIYNFHEDLNKLHIKNVVNIDMVNDLNFGDEFSKQISKLVLIIAVIITILLIFKDVPYHEIFLSVIALAVSAMPEGLPLALTMALTIGSNKMAKQNVIVRRLNAVESLGSCTVIASDKTGTLTVNEQTAKKIILPNNTSYEITGTGYEPKGKIIGENIKYAEEIALYGTINNEASINGDKLVGDSIDLAFLVLGKKLKVKKDSTKIVDSIPYESENKYSAVFYEKNGETYCTIKGSLEKVL